MPTTPRGITYPDSTGTAETWVHWQSQAETTDAAIGEALGGPAHGDRYLSAATQAIANATDVPVAFDAAVQADLGITWDGTDKQWEIEEAGVYLFNASVTGPTGIAGDWLVSLVRERAAVLKVLSSLDGPVSGVTWVLAKASRFQVGDLVSVVVHQSSGSSKNISGLVSGDPKTTCDVTRIGV